MSNKTFFLSDELYEYILGVSLREDDVLRKLREKTAKLPQHAMQIAPEQGQFMAMLVRMLGAERTLDIGVFTGYSSLVVARALPEHGQVIACDVSEEWTAIARRHWKKANVGHKIRLHIAPALETLDTLLADGHGGTFDFAFIDADKVNYEHYYERCLGLVRMGGVIAVDNVLWNGEVMNAHSEDEDTQAIRDFNEKLHNDRRIDLSLVPIADGLTLARKTGK